MSRSCPEARLAALGGAGVPSEEHARTCPSCRAERASVRQIMDLAADLPWTPPTPARVEELRSALYTLGPVVVRPWWRRRSATVAAAAALVLTLGGALLLWPRERPAVMPAQAVVWPTLPEGTEPAERSSIIEGPGARFLREPQVPGQAEAVRLSEGSIRLDRTPLVAGEVMRVLTQDAELEAIGQSFEVEASGDRLTGVRAISATVVVRMGGRAELRLEPGQSWSRAPAPSASPAAPQVTPEPKRRLSQRAAPAPTPVATPRSEQLFKDAWAAFARGDMQEAAELFGASEAADPAGSMVEDACYGRAVALERAGRRGEAITLMRDFLARFPTSARADEVSVALGWELIEAGQLEEARARLAHAAESPVSRVHQSAARGLEEIARRRK